MQTISLKMEDTLLKDIDSLLRKYRYSTRTEFIRDAIRKHLSELEKQECLRKLELYKGALKGKARCTDEEARERALKTITTRLGMNISD